MPISSSPTSAHMFYAPPYVSMPLPSIEQALDNVDELAKTDCKTSGLSILLSAFEYDISRLREDRGKKSSDRVTDPFISILPGSPVLSPGSPVLSPDFHFNTASLGTSSLYSAVFATAPTTQTTPAVASPFIAKNVPVALPKKKNSKQPGFQATATHCTNCFATKTSLWRRDQEGNTVCNSCRLYEKLHGSKRPASLRKDTIVKRTRISKKSDPSISTTTSNTKIGKRTESPQLSLRPLDTQTCHFPKFYPSPTFSQAPIPSPKIKLCSISSLLNSPALCHPKLFSPLNLSAASLPSPQLCKKVCGMHHQHHHLETRLMANYESVCHGSLRSDQVKIQWIKNPTSPFVSSAFQTPAQFKSD